MKILNGKELAEFIMQRQAQQARHLAAFGAKPKLAIVQTIDDEISDTYLGLKIAYGEDIGVDVVKHFSQPSEVKQLIERLNNDDSVNGIIVQLPLAEGLEQDEILNLVTKDKDVDGLSQNSPFDPPTPTAIMWLLSGYNIETRGKNFVVVGQGRLVGAPLTKMLLAGGNEVVTADESTTNLEELVTEADIIITATGRPKLINSSMIPENAVVIDAGVAVDSGKKTGDLADDVYERDDLKITPKVGGVGPLTVAALFDNVLKAASAKA